MGGARPHHGYHVPPGDDRRSARAPPLPRQTVTPPLVQFTAADAPLLLELSESIGWPHEIGDWQTTLAASQVFGHRAADGKILSSSSIYQFGPTLAALAVVLVREESR